MSLVEGVAVCTEGVHRVVVACGAYFVEVGKAGAGGVGVHFSVGRLAIVERIAAVHVAVLIEAICEVACDCELLDRLDVHAESIRKVGLALDVAV